MAKYWHLIWKIPGYAVSVVLGLVLLLLIAAAGILITPSARTAVLQKGIELAQEQTGWDINVGNLYLSPFHHSPMVLYRAYKGEADLPLQVEIDSLFVGHRGQDTLIYVHALRLRAKVLTGSNGQLSEKTNLLDLPIVVEALHLDGTTFHSDSLIAAVGLNIIVGNLDVSSPNLNIAKGEYPLHGLDLADTYVGIDLRSTPDTTAKDTTPMLMAFDVPDGRLRNLEFMLTPTGLDIHTAELNTNVLADVGGNKYDVRRIDAGYTSLNIGELLLPFDTLYGNACVDLKQNLITSRKLHARSDEIGAEADLSATMLDLGTMRVDVTADADFRGSKAQVLGYYDIDDQSYDISADVEQVDLSSILKDHRHIGFAGYLHAEGKGIDPNSRAMRSKVQLHLTEGIYENFDVSGIRLDAELADKTVGGTLHLPFTMHDSTIYVKAETDHRFRVSEFMKPEQMQVEEHAQFRHVRVKAADENIAIDSMDLHFATADTTALDIGARGLSVRVNSPMHVLKLVEQVQPLLRAAGDSATIRSITSLTDLTMLDTIRRLVPDIQTDIVLTHGSPAQPYLTRAGLDIDTVALTLASDEQHTALALDASMPEINHPEDSTALRLPAAKAALRLKMTEGKTNVSLAADSKLTDGVMSAHDIKTDAAFRMDLERTGRMLNGTGRLTLDSLSMGKIELGYRSAEIQISPSEQYANALKADVQLNEIPMDLVDSIMQIADIDIKGSIHAQASVDGLPAKPDISAEVLPKGVAVRYTPYDIELGLGDHPITMEHNHVSLDAFPIYGADSTYLALTGELDLNTMRVDVVLAADSFAPAKLPQDGPIPVYGELATDIHGRVSGPLDSICADVAVTLLPTTDITYPIDKKNLAQVKPHGTVNIRYDVAKSNLNLGGRINVDDGFIRYSPKAYPIMPFHVDSGSHVAFNGPIGKTMLDVSASQKVKISVQSEDEDTRRVDFITGVRVYGEVDSIDLSAIGFFLEAPEDETITNELASLDEETREGIAATLLATGMYVGESNVSAQKSGYALSSIINSRLNAAMANSKMGKLIDVDVSSGQSQHTTGVSNDLNIAVSKSFFKDRLRVSLGATLSDNPEVYSSTGFLNNITAEYKLTKDGNISLRAFGQRDFNNILEGDLIKSGIGVRATRQWQRQHLIPSSPDTITRTYGLTADADIAWRSNNSIGPNLTLTHSIKNLIGHGETFTVKANGAYYWALRNRHPNDPRKTDTYKLGATASLVFPYLHWAGDNHPEGDTRYMLGYQYENIAGGYGVHKASGSLTYFIRSSKYITHAFTPFSLSVVRMRAETDSLLNKAAEYPQLIKILVGDEFVPAIGYHFTYDNYRSKRAVNTMIDLGFKEAGNLINGIYCLFGHKWNEKKKPMGSITFNQLIKLSAELHNKFNLTDQVCFATRIFAGANIPLGNSEEAPLSEAFYAGGPNNMRSAAPYAYGPGNFYSSKYNQNFFHAGDVKLEANFELRFPIVWKLYGAMFVDAGNVWAWYGSAQQLKDAGYDNYKEILGLHEDLHDGIYNNPYLLRQIALGTGTGLRLDYEGLVVRLDIGVGIHAPYQTYKRNKKWELDYNQPINTYFNMPTALDALRINFGIGYPF